MTKDEALRKRLSEEMTKLPYKNWEIGKLVECDSSLISKYKQGIHLPGVYHLAGLYELGVDVIYILTGERTR